MRDQPSSPDTDYQSSPEGHNKAGKMRARGGSQFGGPLFGLNNDMDQNCRRDLPSPKHESAGGARNNSSPREPKSPPKSVRFTEEDEVIEKSSA
jgi:hypothetical protein